MSSQKERVIRFKPAERLTHLVVVVTFLLLTLSGLAILKNSWFGGLAALFGGMDNARVIHHWTGLVFGVALLVALIFGYQAWTRHILSWDADDKAFASKTVFVTLGTVSYSQMPPQGKYNGGQKGWSLIVAVSGLILLVTGLILWQKEAIGSASLVQWSLPLHDFFSMVLWAGVIGHFFQAVIHPETRESLWALRDGTVSAEYARSHHAKWYKALKG